MDVITYSTMKLLKFASANGVAQIGSVPDPEKYIR